MAIKINKKWENSIANNTLVSVTENTQDYDGQPAEKVIQWLSYSHVNNVNKNIDDLYSYLRYLDAKISSVRKTATLWDAYNIRTSVQTSEEFYQKYASLPSNSALVINTNSTIEIDEQSYQNGDIVIKDYLNNPIVVKNTLSGCYKPVSATVDTNNNILLNFAFQSHPTEDQINIEIENSKLKSETLVYSRLLEMQNKSINAETQQEVTTIYNQRSIPLQYLDAGKKNKIMPVWECRTYIDNIIGDRVFNAIQCSITDTEIVFSRIDMNNTPKIPLVILVK